MSKKVEEEAPKEEIEVEIKKEKPKQEKVKETKKKAEKKEKKVEKVKDHKHKAEELPHEDVKIIEEEAVKEPEVETEEQETEEVNGIKITYFAHGTTFDNEKKIFTGQSQGQLSELGKKQSIELKDKINIKDFDVVFTSDLKRAIDTANLTFKDSKIKVIQDKRLRECDCGDLNEAKEEEVIFLDHISEKFPNGESLNDVEKRIANFLNYLLDNYKGKRIAIISHKAPQLAFDVLINKKTWKEAINEDWRIKKAWQPGWYYELTEHLEVKEEKKGFFSKLFGKKELTWKEELNLAEDYVKDGPDEWPEEKLNYVLEKAKEKAIIERIDISERIEKIRNLWNKKINIKETSEEEKPEVEEVKEEKKGFFGAIKEKITTTKISNEKFEELFNELELALLENNVAFEVVEKIKEDMKKEIVDKPIKRGQVEEEIKNSLKSSVEDLFNIETINLLERTKTKKPYVICFVGINGSGKTTSIAKVAHLLQKNKKSVVLAAADTFRAAAIQQLKEWGSRLNLKVIAHDYGSDPAAVAFDAIKYAEAHSIDVVLIDTAGRLHSNKDLMREMEKIVRVAKPDMKIFIGEAITGNDCTEQAKEFNELISIDGIILSKADVDEKGGAMVSVSYITKKPILYLGVGQEPEDLKEFNKDEIIKGLGL